MAKILAFASPLLISAPDGVDAQPVWVANTPSVVATESMTITLNYGINITGNVYYIVYNFNNTAQLTSSYVRTNAQLGPSGTKVASGVLPVRKADAQKVLQVVINVSDPDQVYTIYLVAADSKNRLQATPVRLTATTKPCPKVDAGEGGNNCGLDFYLNAHPGNGSGLWTLVSGPGSASFSPEASDSAAKVTVSQPGIYVFRWTETSVACVSSDTITVSFGQASSADAGNGGDVCEKVFKLNAIPQGGIGTWSEITGAGNAVFTPDAHQPDALVTVTQYGDYNFAWTEVQNDCSSTDVIKVGFHSQPELSAGPDLSVCRGNTVQLSASGSGSFQWSPANLLDNPLIQNPVAYTQNNVTFTVTLTDLWGCHNTDQVLVVVKDTPVASAGQDQVLDFVFKASLDAGSLMNGETGEWLLTGGTGSFENKNSPVTQVSNLSIGKNTMVWTVTNGTCPASSDTLSITVNNLVLPSLITPNMDGKNDFFIIKGIQSMGKAVLTVFNRWGEVVFSSDNYDNKWDGNDNNGNALPEDTYFIILKSENSRPVSGFVVIRR